MNYIFKEWEKKLSAFEDSVDKKLEDIRQCKEEVQQLKSELTNHIQKGQYIRDDQRLILSAPEVIIGNLDPNGLLYSGAGSTVVIRGAEVSLQGVGEGGQVNTRASSIRQTAEDPGIDGQEHVVTGLSQVVSQARNIVLQSDNAEGTFSTVIEPAAGSGIRIHADQNIEIGALATAEKREKRLDKIISSFNDRKSELKKLASDHKSNFKELVKEIEKLLDDKTDLLEDDNDARTNYQDIYFVGEEIERVSGALSDAMYAYSQTLSMLAEVNRQIKCFTKEKDAIKKGDDFKKKSTGTSVSIASESVNISSLDGDGNIRDNEGAGIGILGNKVNILSNEVDGKLKKEGQVRIQAKTVEVTTAGADKVVFDENEHVTDSADFIAEGDIIMTSKNITLESLDYIIKEKKRQEKGLTEKGRINVRAKTVEVSTENSSDVKVNEEGQITDVKYTAIGDIIVKSKTVTVESVDYDVEGGTKKEKALTDGGKVSVRAEKMDLSATNTEGKATGSVSMNAKAVTVKSMDVDKESKADSALAAGSTMVLVSEKMFVGAKTKDIKSTKVQMVSQEVGAFADKTLEIQQGDGKALVQLEGGNASVGGSKTQLYGETTVNAKTEIKGELKAPKVSADDIQAGSHFKSPNTEDGMPAAPAGGGGSLSAKLKTEDAPAEKS
jgi:hypothetical protein